MLLHLNKCSVSSYFLAQTLYTVINAHCSVFTNNNVLKHFHINANSKRFQICEAVPNYSE